MRYIFGKNSTLVPHQFFKNFKRGIKPRGKVLKNITYILSKNHKKIKKSQKNRKKISKKNQKITKNHEKIKKSQKIYQKIKKSQKNHEKIKKSRTPFLEYPSAISYAFMHDI